MTTVLRDNDERIKALQTSVGKRVLGMSSTFLAHGVLPGIGSVSPLPSGAGRSSDDFGSRISAGRAPTRLDRADGPAALRVPERTPGALRAVSVATAPLHRLRVCRYLLEAEAVLRGPPLIGGDQGRENAKPIEKQAHRSKHVRLALRSSPDSWARFAARPKVVGRQEPSLDQHRDADLHPSGEGKKNGRRA